MTRVLISLAILILSGCANLSDIRSVPIYMGNALAINHSMDEVSSRLKLHTFNQGLELQDSYTADGEKQVFIYSTGFDIVSDGLMTGVSYGEWIRVVLDSEGQNLTRVTVFVEKKAAFNFVSEQGHSADILRALSY